MPAETTPLLSAQALSLRAGSRQLVDDLSFALAAGERLVVVGPNGSGKSTLLRALAGLGKAAAGSVTRPDSPPGMLFQDGALWPHLSVEEHLAFVDRGAHGSWREHLLERLRLVALRRAKPEQLSGGERVRLGLARAFAARPAWVLLDEPLAALDANFGDLMRSFLPRTLDELGAAAVIVSHEADCMALLGSRVLCLSGSGPWWLGDTATALFSPPTPLLAALAGSGTVLAAVADARGHAHFGAGIALDGRTPGEACWVFLEPQQVSLAAEGHGLAGTWMATDPRGGGWVSVDDCLLRCPHAGAPPAPGSKVSLSIKGRARVLRADGAGSDA